MKDLQCTLASTTEDEQTWAYMQASRGKSRISLLGLSGFRLAQFVFKCIIVFRSCRSWFIVKSRCQQNSPVEVLQMTSIYTQTDKLIISSRLPRKKAKVLQKKKTCHLHKGNYNFTRLHISELHMTISNDLLTRQISGNVVSVKS